MSYIEHDDKDYQWEIGDLNNVLSLLSSDEEEEEGIKSEDEDEYNAN